MIHESNHQSGGLWVIYRREVQANQKRKGLDAWESLSKKGTSKEGLPALAKSN